MAILFGEPRRAGELFRSVPKRLGLVEVSAAAQLAKPARLKTLAEQSPGLAFSVVTSDKVFGPEAASARAAARAAAAALGAKYLVVRGAARPSASSEREVSALLAEFAGAATHVVFEPPGLWQRPRVRALCAAANAVFAQRLEELEEVSHLYLRIVQLGMGRSLVTRKWEPFMAALAASNDAAIVVEGGGAVKLRARVEAELADLTAASEFGAPAEDGEGEDEDDDSDDFDAEDFDEGEDDDEDQG